MSLPVSVVCGLDRAAVTAAGREMLSLRPGARLVMHCLDQLEVGLISRTTINDAGSVEAELIELEHGCVSCTLREDVLPNLCAAARDSSIDEVVLLLPEAVEPIGFVESFFLANDGHGHTTADFCHIESVLTVVDSAKLVPDLSNVETLQDRRLNINDDDDRGLGDVLVGQIECADLILAPNATAQERQLISLLNSEARILFQVPERNTRVFDFARTVDRTTPAQVPHDAKSCRVDDVWLLTWRADRPLHPGRLYDALEAISEVALRGRGHLRVAGRESQAVEWDSVGAQLRLGAPNIDITTGKTELQFVGVSDRSYIITDVLEAAQLTDPELANPESLWSGSNDPFTQIWQSMDQTDSEES